MSEPTPLDPSDLARLKRAWTGALTSDDADRLLATVEQRDAEVHQRDERIAELEKQRRVLVSQLWEATRSEGRLHAALHEIKRRLNYYEPDLHGCADIIDDALTSGG